jgi:hypothetical protein
MWEHSLAGRATSKNVVTLRDMDTVRNDHLVGVGLIQKTETLIQIEDKSEIRSGPYIHT